ncbi:hypothetical protein Tco_1398405, partial [Tanacetum coccineum]
KKGNLTERVVALKEELKLIQIKSIENVHDVDIKKIAANKLRRKHKSFIGNICDENGIRYSRDEVPKQFFTHFKNFLGVSRETESITNAQELFTQKVINNEGIDLCKDVTTQEIDEALKSIDDNKAPGYKAKFFKAAWEVIGFDVYEAIKEFFQNGKLLGEVNATIISLVPKIKTPAKFLEKVLEGFGFPGKFIRWVMTCVSTVAFSICVNGESHDYFEGGGGEQGLLINKFLQCICKWNILTYQMELHAAVMKEQLSP